MTLATAKQKVLKAIKLKQRTEAMGLISKYNYPLIVCNKVSNSLNSMEDRQKLSQYYSKHC